MEFSSFRKEKDKKELEVELKVLKESLNNELSRGDRVVLEKKISKLEKEIQELKVKLEDTTTSDIANTQMNLFANCTGKNDCKCGKCQLLRKEKLKESKEFSPFASIFGA